MNAAATDALRQSAKDAFLASVRPPEWKTPTPRGRYPFLVIGGGPAGMLAAYRAALLGAKVALIERHWLGGKSLSYGSVPTKTLLRTSRFYADMHSAQQFGASPQHPERPELDLLISRAARIRSRIGKALTATQLKAVGVDVYFGTARFTSLDSVDVNGVELRFKKAMVATGSAPKAIDIPGLKEAGYIDAALMFEMRNLPRRVLVIGGGANGCEGAQGLARLGVETVIAMDEPHFLPGEERDAAQMVSDTLAQDGVEIHLNTRVIAVRVEGGRKVVDMVNDGDLSTVVVDEIFAGLGHEPSVAGLDLDRAGIAYDEQNGIKVDDFLRTTNWRVYAAGDVCLEPRYTSIACASAGIVVRNALFWGRQRYSAMVIPWCTYTDPEIAHVGMYVREARMRNISVKTYTVSMHEVDRAMADGEETGFVKIHIQEGSDKILGATIVARHAGEMINEISLAIVAGVGLRTLGGVLRAYPTQAEAIKIAADRYRASRLTWWRRWLVRAWLNR